MFHEYLSTSVSCYPCIVALWAFIETFLLAGLTAGWASLVYVLKKEQIYGYLCENQPSSGNNSALSLDIGYYYYLWNGSFESVQGDHSLRIDNVLRNSSSFSRYFSRISSSSGNLGNHSFFTFDEEANLPRNTNGSLPIGRQYNVFEASHKAIKQVSMNGTLRNSSSGIFSWNPLNQFLTSGQLGPDQWVDNVTCSLQDDRFQLCVTVSLIISAPLCLLLSRLNYQYGIRITRLVSITSLLTGSASFGLISTDFPWLIFPGYLGLLVGGIGILQTNIQVSYMFEKYGSTVIGALSGGFDASGSVLLVTKIAYENGISLKVSFFIICVSNVIILISTFILLPKDFIQRKYHQLIPSETEIKDVKTCVDLSEETSLVTKNSIVIETKEYAFCENIEKQNVQELKGAVSTSKGENSTLWSYIRSPLYLLQSAWATVNILVMNMFLGSLNSWLEKVSEKQDEKVSFYTNVNYYAMLSAPVFSLLFGFLVDFSYFFQSDRKTGQVRILHSLVVPSVFTSVTGFVLCIGVMVENEEVTYFVAVTSVIYRAAIFSFLSSNLRFLYPTEYFGALYGSMLCVCGVMTFLTYPLFLWCQSSESGYQQVYGVLGVSALFTLSHPLYLLHLARKTQALENNYQH